MSERIIKTGLSKKYKDMLDSVRGQMSDGYWENTPMMEGYWKFCDIGTVGDETTIEVDTYGGERDGDRFIKNRFNGMSDDAIKKFFADKIKFLIKEEGLGKWDRGNERETDFLSHGTPRYRVKDCYYAYEILKGRNAHKHPEYGDVAEAYMKINESALERALEEVAQVTNILTYNDAWRLSDAADDNKELRQKIRSLLNDFEDAAYEDDDVGMNNIARKLKELADSDTPLMIVPFGESRKVVRTAYSRREGATYDEYVYAVADRLVYDFEYGPITALEFARDDFKDITKACYRTAKDPKEAAKEIDALYMGEDESCKKAEGRERLSEASDAINALFKQMVDDQGCRLLDGSNRGVEYRDQYNTKVFYQSGKLYFNFSKYDAEEDLLDLAEKITSYGPATIVSSDDCIEFALILPENKAIEAIKDFFEVD